MTLIARGLVALVICAAGLVQHASAQPAITDHVTPGGLPFRYSLMPDALEQTIQFGWKDGQAFARETGQGLASLGPNLILQGPKGIPRGEYVEDLKDAQARLSLNSATHYTMGGIVAPYAKFSSAVELFAQVLAQPALDEARLDELRKQYAASLRQQASNPGVASQRIAAQLLYGDKVLRDWQAGAASIYDHVTIADIRSWHQSVFSREGLFVAAAGKLTPEEAGEQIDKLFGGLPAKGAASSHRDFAQSSLAKTVVFQAPVAQTHLLVIGWSGFAPGPDLAAGQIAARVLRTRLFKAVREKMGASYGASAQLLSPLPEPYLFSYSTSVAHDKGKEALAAINSEFTTLVTKGITAEELEAEKSKITSELLETFRRPLSVASLVRNAQITGRPADHVATSLQRVAVLTPEKVNAAITAHLGSRPMATIIVAPDESKFEGCVITSPDQASRCR
jgi:zinc protease